MNDKKNKTKKRSLLREYDRYFSVLESFSDLLARARSDARDGKLSLEKIEELRVSNLDIPVSEILYLQSIFYLSAGDESSALALLTEVVRMHPMPLAETWELCRLHYKKGNLIEAAFYANMLEEMDCVRSQNSFVDAAKTLKAIVLRKLGFATVAKCVYTNIKKPYFRIEGKPMLEADIENMIYE